MGGEQYGQGNSDSWLHLIHVLRAGFPILFIAAACFA